MYSGGGGGGGRPAACRAETAEATWTSDADMRMSIDPPSTALQLNSLNSTQLNSAQLNSTQLNSTQLMLALCRLAPSAWRRPPGRRRRRHGVGAGASRPELTSAVACGGKKTPLMYKTLTGIRLHPQDGVPRSRGPWMPAGGRARGRNRWLLNCFFRLVQPGFII